MNHTRIFLTGLLFLIFAGTVVAQENSITHKDRSDRFSVSLAAGASWVLVEVNEEDPNLKALLEDLKSGLTVRGHGLYHLGKGHQVGLMLNLFTSHGETIYPFEGQNVGGITIGAGNINLDVDDHLIFVGPMYEFGKFSKDKKHYYSVNAAIGFASYTIKTNASGDVIPNGFHVDQKYRGTNIGFDLGFSYRYFLLPNFGLGLNLNLPYTTIDEFENTSDNAFIDIQGLLEDRENLLRLDLAFGATYRF